MTPFCNKINGFHMTSWFVNKIFLKQSISLKISRPPLHTVDVNKDVQDLKHICTFDFSYITGKQKYAFRSLQTIYRITVLYFNTQSIKFWTDLIVEFFSKVHIEINTLQKRSTNFGFMCGFFLLVHEQQLPSINVVLKKKKNIVKLYLKLHKRW